MEETNELQLIKERGIESNKNNRTKVNIDSLLNEVSQ